MAVADVGVRLLRLGRFVRFLRFVSPQFLLFLQSLLVILKGGEPRLGLCVFTGPGDGGLQFLEVLLAEGECAGVDFPEDAGEDTRPVHHFFDSEDVVEESTDGVVDGGVEGESVPVDALEHTGETAEGGLETVRRRFGEPSFAEVLLERPGEVFLTGTVLVLVRDGPGVILLVQPGVDGIEVLLHLVGREARPDKGFHRRFQPMRRLVGKRRSVGVLEEGDDGFLALLEAGEIDLAFDDRGVLRKIFCGIICIST